MSEVVGRAEIVREVHREASARGCDLGGKRPLGIHARPPGELGIHATARPPAVGLPVRVDGAAWAAWAWLDWWALAASEAGGQALNRTQPIPCRKEVLVSLRERRGTLRLRPVATYAHVNSLESRQGPTAQRSGEQGAARIRDMAVAEVEALEGLEHAG